MNQPATRPTAAQAPGVAVEIKAQIPGHAVVVLADGTTIVGRLVAGAARLKPGAKDQNGNNVYDVDWGIDTGHLISAKG